MPKLSHSLNQLVIIANPTYFGDDAPRRVILVDIEDAGLWFSGDALKKSLAQHELTTPPEGAMATIFFPYEQIAYLFDPRQFAQPVRGLRPATSVAALQQRQLTAPRAAARPTSGRRPSGHHKPRR